MKNINASIKETNQSYKQVATGKTFFSYSRTDSAFVMRLAKDLRDAGVAIWLDQLDIKGGSHWDSAIETALNDAPNVIVVLSNESVKSDNVMDEVSFALESDKTVIPVWLQQCTVPFRLRRLQRIDFTGDYLAGFSQLLELLNQIPVSDNQGSVNLNETETDKKRLQQVKRRNPVLTDEQSSAIPKNSFYYLMISGVGLIAVFWIGYYYFHNMVPGNTEEKDSRIFYLILLLFGIAVSALIFGIMNSYASLKGIPANVSYKFTGPIVGVILTLLGSFLIPKHANDRFLTIRVFDEDKNPVAKGNVTLTFPHYQRSASMNEKGMVVFPEIPYDQLRSKIIINVQSDGYASRNIDTLLSNFDPIDLTVVQAKIIRLSGTVKDAADRPIKDVEIVVDGTPYGTKTINDGSFEIPIPGYHFGDRVTLVTSHPNYEDKIKHFDIESGKIDKMEFVLNPVSTTNTQHKR